MIQLRDDSHVATTYMDQTRKYLMVNRISDS
jgi:hypothetical protein